MMRELRYIPMRELRRQYRREREIKDSVLSTILMVSCTAAFTLIYLFG